MKIYVASRHQHSAQLVGNFLASLGHKIVSTWVYDTSYQKDRSPQAKRAGAEKDLLEIRDADALVLISQADGDYSPGGRHVEFGYALGLGKKLFVFSRHENVFHHLEQVIVVTDLQELRTHIDAHLVTIADQLL